MKQYTDNELQMDLYWFEGLGIGKKEAKKYIQYLLDKKGTILK